MLPYSCSALISGSIQPMINSALICFPSTTSSATIALSLKLNFVDLFMTVWRITIALPALLVLTLVFRMFTPSRFRRAFRCLWKLCLCLICLLISISWRWGATEVMGVCCSGSFGWWLWCGLNIGGNRWFSSS